MSTRHPNANSVLIEPDRFKRFFWLRRLPLTAVGPIVGRSEGWASVMANRKSVSYWTLDQLATALDVHVDEMIAAIGIPEELARLSV